MRHLPNLITLCNLLCGCLAISAGDTGFGFFFIILAAVCDLLDGLVARLLNAASAMGKDLDSLADIVSFGVAPAWLVWKEVNDQVAQHGWWSYSLWLLPLAAAWRLARFNNDTVPKQWFEGLPAPANGLFWSGGAITIYLHGLSGEMYYVIVPLMAVVFALLMVSRIRLLNLKFDKPNTGINRWRMMLLVAEAVMVAVVWWFIGAGAALALAIVLYFLISVIVFYIVKPEIVK